MVLLPKIILDNHFEFPARTHKFNQFNLNKKNGIESLLQRFQHANKDQNKILLHILRLEIPQTRSASKL